ncbi:MAG: hydrogen peroxide-inducible genes activator [Gammaproteobacteria bacterium]|nr:hydrogen peroxide-inducible genes activator [Gammaproteobacteria bacterium]
MTLTELKYIVAVARIRHFGRAAEACFVSQPTLSVAVRKLEDELGVTLFERNVNEVTPTPVGEQVVAQAQRALEAAEEVRRIASQSKDPLVGPLRLGAIYTIGPYLMPGLIPSLRQRAAQMPLLIQENYTLRLADMLRRGELDLVVLSLPFAEPGIVTQAVYDEPFRVVLPADHAWLAQREIPAAWVGEENVLLLTSGNCFRDQVLQAFPMLNRSASGMQKTLEGSSLETIRYMVASGTGITVLPSTAADAIPEHNSLLATRPFAAPGPSRRVALAWRKSFPRIQAVEAVRQAILASDLPGVAKLDEPPTGS